MNSINNFNFIFIFVKKIRKNGVFFIVLVGVFFGTYFSMFKQMNEKAIVSPIVSRMVPVWYIASEPIQQVSKNVLYSLDVESFSSGEKTKKLFSTLEEENREKTFVKENQSLLKKKKNWTTGFAVGSGFEDGIELNCFCESAKILDSEQHKISTKNAIKIMANAINENTRKILEEVLDDKFIKVGENAKQSKNTAETQAYKLLEASLRLIRSGIIFNNPSFAADPKFKVRVDSLPSSSTSLPALKLTYRGLGISPYSTYDITSQKMNFFMRSATQSGIKTEAEDFMQQAFNVPKIYAEIEGCFHRFTQEIVELLTDEEITRESIQKNTKEIMEKITEFTNLVEKMVCESDRVNSKPVLAKNPTKPVLTGNFYKKISLPGDMCIVVSLKPFQASKGNLGMGIGRAWFWSLNGSENFGVISSVNYEIRGSVVLDSKIKAQYAGRGFNGFIGIGIVI